MVTVLMLEFVISLKQSMTVCKDNNEGRKIKSHFDSQSAKYVQTHINNLKRSIVTPNLNAKQILQLADGHVDSSTSCKTIHQRITQ